MEGVGRMMRDSALADLFRPKTLNTDLHSDMAGAGKARTRGDPPAAYNSTVEANGRGQISRRHLDLVHVRRPMGNPASELQKPAVPGGSILVEPLLGKPCA